MSTIVKPYTFASGALIVASEHNSNFDTIYTDHNGGITNANISASAAISITKLSGVAASGANSDITSLTGLTTPLAPTKGGTGVAQASASSTLTISGAFATTLTVTGTTGVTLPTSGTLLASGGALGTPSSGTLTNCTGLPVAGITASTSTALGVGSIELGHATDTTIARSGAGAITVEGVQVILSGAALGTPSSGTLTNCTGLPAASVVAGTLGSGTFTTNRVNYSNNAITASGNAATVPITSKLNTVTNNSAATLTITMTTTSAVDGQMTIVRILDFSAAAQTITWVNTENSTVSAPTTSNGSTTLFLTVGFIYNSGTSKWRCIASA